MKKPIEEEAPDIIVTPANEFYLCKSISREMFNMPGKIQTSSTSVPHMPLSVSKVLAVWPPQDQDKTLIGDVAIPVYMPGDVVIHREQQQNTFAPHPLSPKLLFVHSTMIVGKVRGLVKDKQAKE